MAIEQQKSELIQLLHRNSVKHRFAGKILYLKTRNYISLPDDVTATLVTLTTRYGYIIQLEG